jgi:hypothetical protein
MADFMYNKGRQRFATKLIDWINDTVRVYLVDGADYPAPDPTDEYLSSIPAGGRVAYADLLGKTATDGVCDADNTILTGVTGDPCEMLVLVLWTGDPATSALIVKLDSYSGLPVTPNGGNITITWPSDANKIFKL